MGNIIEAYGALQHGKIVEFDGVEYKILDGVLYYNPGTAIAEWRKSVANNWKIVEQEELKPCIFCDGKTRINNIGGNYWISCLSSLCAAQSPMRKSESEKEALQAHNTVYDRLKMLFDKEGK